MAMNRLTRDEIINRGLDMVDSSPLDLKDRPAGELVPNALSIGWLQDALDYFQKKFPFQCNIVPTPVTLSIGTSTLAVPALYIIDVKNGLVLDNNGGRLLKRSLNYILDRSAQAPSAPTVYTIRTNLIHFWPTADKTYTAKLWMYSLDAALTADIVPNFPDDHILVEYIRLRGLEWHRSIDPGSAIAYADARIKDLKASGIMQDAEDDQLEMDRESYRDSSVDSNDWMGKTTG